MDNLFRCRGVVLALQKPLSYLGTMDTSDSLPDSTSRLHWNSFQQESGNAASASDVGLGIGGWRCGIRISRPRDHAPSRRKEDLALQHPLWPANLRTSAVCCVRSAGTAGEPVRERRE